MKREARRGLIIGGSMSGLFAALYLRQRGWDIDIFERSAVALTGRGAGIMTYPEMRWARRLGSYLRYDFATEDERARAAYHAEPERVLAETALLDFLR